MHRALSLLALALMLLPTAAASAQPLLLTAEPFTPALFKPLATVGNATLGLSVGCDALGDAPAEIALTVAAAPRWANATVTPSSIAVERADCVDGLWTGTATVVARVDETAPAFLPSPIRVRAEFAADGTKQAADADVRVEADYFALLDVSVTESLLVARPGAPATYDVRVVNMGNGPTIVTFEVVDKDGNVVVVVPAPVTLESSATGGARTHGAIPVQAYHEGKFGFNNEHGAFTLRVAAAHALQSQNVTEVSDVTLVLQTKGVQTPAPSLALGLVGIGLVAAALARRRG